MKLKYKYKNITQTYYKNNEIKNVYAVLENRK